MKKLVVVLIVAIALLSLTSCEDYTAKADYEQKQANQQDHNQYKDSGKDEEPDRD